MTQAVPTQVVGGKEAQYVVTVDEAGAYVAGGGGGGGAITVADGADVAQGTTTDAATVNTVIGRLKKLISLLPTALGSATSANSLAVVIASDQGAVATKQTAATATVTSVADQAASTTVLALNASRIGASIYNNSASILYLKYGTTASSTDFTVKLFTDNYHEVFRGYTGKIDGIWSADSTGAALVTELT